MLWFPMGGPTQVLSLAKEAHWGALSPSSSIAPRQSDNRDGKEGSGAKPRVDNHDVQ